MVREHCTHKGCGVHGWVECGGNFHSGDPVSVPDVSEVIVHGRVNSSTCSSIDVEWLRHGDAEFAFACGDDTI